MPGILPMKVIKVGTNAQTRIAQACDRCRSKKIRCDGIRPCCSQCSTVGFECKTSDKLSRRAFPRGYTESLEERVRSLEAEVRDLKELLDEKDEKIDMLSRLHSQSTAPTFYPSPRRPSTSPSALSPGQSQSLPSKEELFQIQQSPYLDGTGDMSYFSGASSSKAFLASFNQKVQESGRCISDFNMGKLLPATPHTHSHDPLSHPITWKAPPRLESDRMIGIYFQEWAPLFPVLHRPSFLDLYQQYMQSPETIVENSSHAQLNLVFGIAALSTGAHDTDELRSIEMQWQAALDAILTNHSMPTLQCLILAQLYCIQRGDYDRLLTYKALAISLSSRLGLHQSQKRFALGTSTCETRKKVFWTLYTLDCFSAVTLGLPKQLKDDDIHCEYPVDADEEYIEESGFKAPCPGESTRLSSALALFRAARILSRVLEEAYPALPSYELSLQKLAALGDELDQWHQSLAPHLRLPFAQDKPSTGTTSSRSPLLCLTYHYIRTIIHRPAVTAGLGDRASSSALAMAASCKHSIQIVQLLAERGLGFSLCLNKDELLVISGLGLLYQGLDLEPNSKLYMDNQKMLATASSLLETAKSPCAVEFSELTSNFMPRVSSPPKANDSVHLPLSRHNSDGGLVTPNFLNFSSPQNKLQKAAQLLAIPLEKFDQRRATFPNISIHQNSLQTQSQPNLTGNPADDHVSRSEPANSPATMSAHLQSTRPSAPPGTSAPNTALPRRLNLDYLSFSNVPTRSHSPDHLHANNRTNHSGKAEPSDWERLLGSIDGGQTNIFDNIYGGPPVEFVGDADEKRVVSPPDGAHVHISNAASAEALAWSSPADLQWALSVSDGAPSGFQAGSFGTFKAQPESVFSLGTDDGSASTGEELFSSTSGNDWGSVHSTNGTEAYAGIVMPDMGGSDGSGLLGAIWETAVV